MNDIVNGLFEAFGFLAIMTSVMKLQKDKSVRGVSPMMTVFFTSWGVWNIYYYPSLHQVVSGAAAALTCLANAYWLVLMFKYRNN